MRALHDLPPAPSIAIRRALSKVTKVTTIGVTPVQLRIGEPATPSRVYRPLHREDASGRKERSYPHRRWDALDCYLRPA
jgi:hypothetical protein